MATRPLESNGCQKRSKETWQGHYHNLVATGWESTELLSEPIDGRKNIAETWTTSRRSTSLISHPGIRGIGTRAPSRWYATGRIVKLVQWKQEKIPDLLRKFSQVFDKNKDDRILLFRRTRELRQRPFNEALRAELEWMSQNWRTYVSQPSSSSSSSQNWSQHEHQDARWSEHQDSQWQDHQWQDHQWWIRRFFQGVSLTGNSDSLVSDGRCRPNTSSHAHCSQSCLVAQVWAQITFTRTCVWLKAQGVHRSCVVPLRTQKNISAHSMFHRTLVGVPDTFSSLCSSPPQTTPTSLPLTGIRSTPLCHVAGRKTVWSSGWTTSSHRLWAEVLYRRQQWAHADQLPLKRNSFNIENDLTTTFAAYENFDSFHQQAAASDSSQHVPASEANPCMASRRHVGPHWETGARLCAKCNCWMDFVERKKGDRDPESVQTLSERRNLHVYLEQKAELAVRGEYAAQKRSSEAEADMDMRNWEQRNADIALCETNRKLESQRLELYEAKQWAAQAHREEMSLRGDLEVRNRLFQESRARNCQEIAELRRIRKSQPVLLWVSSWLKFRICRARWIPWPTQEIFAVLRQRAVLERPTFPAYPWLFRVPEVCWPRFWIVARNTEYCGYFRKRFWTNICSRRTNLHSLPHFKEFGIFLSEIWTWYWRKCKEAGEWNETRTAKFVNTCTTLPKRSWSVWSYWWNDGLSEIPDFGIPSGKISRLRGISQLESQLQDLKYVPRQQILILQCTGSKKLR